jgi:endo-1,4-beta-xylanase
LNSQTSLPVYITEFDIDDGNDSSQSTTYQNLFGVFLDASYIHGITVWGWIAGQTWETNSGIVKGTTPRPAMTWLMQKLGRPIPPN